MTDPPGASLPVVACTLGPAALRDRRGAWGEVLSAGHARVEAAPAGVRISFETTQVAGRVRELAALESECCAFARWTVDETDRHVVLDVASTGEGVAAVREMFRS
jgi:hypothetical protein